MTADGYFSRTRRTRRTTNRRRRLIFRRYDNAAAISPIPFGCGQLMLLSPPVHVGGVPPCVVSRLPSGAWYYRGTIVVLSCYYRGTVVLLSCYRFDAGMSWPERAFMASGMWGAEHPRGRRPAVVSGGRFGAAVFQQGGLRPSSRKNSIMWNSVGIMLNSRGPADSTLAAVNYLLFFNFYLSFTIYHFSPSLVGEKF